MSRFHTHEFDMLPPLAFQKRGGRMTFEGGKGGDAPSADPNIGKSQLRMADLAEQQYADFKADIWPTLKEQSQRQVDMSNKIGQQQFDLNEKNQNVANDYYTRMREKFYPLQDQLLQEAKDYDTEGNFQRQATMAMGDVEDQFSAARESQKRQMQAYGINPTSGAYQGQSNATDIMSAATKAGAATKARTAAEQLGWAKKMDVQGLGAGLAGNQATSTGIALQAGNSALNAGAQGIAAMGAMGNSLAQGYGGAMQGWNNVGTLGVQKYNADVNAYNARQANDPMNSILGAAAGVGMNFALKSDIRTKENIVHVGYLPNGLAVYEYEYKPEFKDSPYAGHGRFRGVMAHEVEKVIPDAVFELDGYKAVDYSKIH